MAEWLSTVVKHIRDSLFVQVHILEFFIVNSRFQLFPLFFLPLLVRFVISLNFRLRELYLLKIFFRGVDRRFLFFFEILLWFGFTTVLSLLMSIFFQCAILVMWRKVEFFLFRVVIRFGLDLQGITIERLVLVIRYNSFFIEKVLPSLIQTISLGLLDLLYLRNICILEHLEPLRSPLLLQRHQLSLFILLQGRYVYLFIFFICFLILGRLFSFPPESVDRIRFKFSIGGDILLGNRDYGRRPFISFFFIGLLLFDGLPDFKVHIIDQFFGYVFFQPPIEIFFILFFCGFSFCY